MFSHLIDQPAVDAVVIAVQVQRQSTDVCRNARGGLQWRHRSLRSCRLAAKLWSKDSLPFFIGLVINIREY